MQKHTENKQPPETRGKTVVYKNCDVYEETGTLIAGGRLHMPYPADLLNWGSATIGRIDTYAIIKLDKN